MQRYLLTTALLTLALSLAAQPAQFKRFKAPVVQNNQLLENGFAGGMNAPQFSEADLNNDGVMDLVVFDRAGSVVMTYINNWTGGTSAYKFAPEYARTFPAGLKNYVLLRDYNHDGAMDIFCNSLQTSSQGVSVFRGRFENNVLHFDPVLFNYPGCSTCDSKIIYYPDDVPGQYNNMSIADVDIPGFDDIDSDGDIDIVAFPSGISIHLWWWRNMSIEKGLGTDTLVYEAYDKCWGKFYENGISGCKASLSDNASDCKEEFQGDIDDRDNLHPGATVLPIDMDGNGIKDLITGTISFPCLNQLYNTGTIEAAWMSWQDSIFPYNNTQTDINTFVAAYHLDLNGDGKKDLIAAPNSTTLAEDRAGVWFYENVSTNDSIIPELVTKRLFQGTMIDQGTSSHPAFADVNADGLIDLVVGNFGYHTNNVYTNARLALYLNNGTSAEPKFTLSNPDWLELSQLGTNSYDYSPAFGDLDNDGDTDLLIGNFSGFLLAYFNQAGPGQPMQLQRDFNTMWLNMDVGNSSMPCIVDVNSDSRPDILVGNLFGTIAYFQNTGSLTEPQYGVDETVLPNLSSLGAINTQIVPNGIGYSAPAVINYDGKNLIVCGTQDGHLEAYELNGASNQPFTAYDLQFGNLDEGRRSCPAFADLNDDGILELAIGNLRGGVTLYSAVKENYTSPVGTETPDLAPLQVSMTPNPATDQVQLSAGQNGPVRWAVYDQLGRIMTTANAPTGNQTLSVANWPAGLYWVTAQTAGQQWSGKLVVER